MWILAPPRGLAVAALAAALAPGLAPPAAALTIDWVTVGRPGNACDPTAGGCFGAVADAYRIGRTEVTHAQYAEFLNAVAATDTHGLYSPGMAGLDDAQGGITRSGDPGSHGYAAIAGREQRPVNFVSFWDALRFANWLHNGQPTGAQDGATTEDGAYTITAQGVADNTIARNAGAAVFLPSEDEWYKAAYHDATGLQPSGYFDYPAGHEARTRCSVPNGAANRANCNGQVGTASAVGSYTGSPSPYGTFDQGGNVSEWNEAIDADGPDGRRGVRGGSFLSDRHQLAAFSRGFGLASSELDSRGFRVASVPEPGTGALLALGVLGLACRRGARRGVQALRRPRAPGAAGTRATARARPGGTRSRSRSGSRTW